MTEDITLNKKGRRRVTVFTTNIDYNLTKILPVLTFPTSSDGQDIDTGPKTTKLIDLARLEERYTVDGVVQTGYGTGDSNSSAFLKQQDIKDIVRAGGNIHMTLLGASATGATAVGNIDKLTIKEVPQDDSGATANPDKVYDIKFTFVIGTSLQSKPS